MFGETYYGYLNIPFYAKISCFTNLWLVSWIFIAMKKIYKEKNTYAYANIKEQILGNPVELKFFNVKTHLTALL